MDFRNCVHSNRIEDRESCDYVMSKMLQKYPDGRKYDKKVTPNKMEGNKYRDGIKAAVRIAQSKFFNPDRPRKTGITVDMIVIVFYKFSFLKVCIRRNTTKESMRSLRC